RPRAAGAAGVGVVAVVAVAPEVLHGAVAGEAQGGRALPDVAQAVLADVAADVVRGRERGAALDVAVRLDAEGGSARAARGEVAARHGAAELGFVGAEVAEVVAGPDADLRLVREDL